MIVDSSWALWPSHLHRLRVSCQKGPTRHAYAWQIGPFWQDILEHILHSDGELTFNQFSHQHWVSINNLWRLWCQKQVSSVGINNYTAYFIARCNCLCLSYILASGTNVLLLYQNSSLIITKSNTYSQHAIDTVLLKISFFKGNMSSTWILYLTNMGIPTDKYNVSAYTRNRGVFILKQDPGCGSR